MKQVEIITIGDELLIGQVVDTNSAYIARCLNEWGLVVKQITSVHDDHDHILAALDEALRRADIVLITGGLGPTKDDITKRCLCDYFHTDLVYRDDIHDHLLCHYANRPDVLNRLTDAQCLFPVDAELIWNRVGSAQVMVFADRVVSMPGVPREMEWCMQNGVGEWLRLHSDNASVVHRTLLLQGIPESSLAILIEDWEDALPASMHLAYLPKDGRIRLRLSGYDVPAADVDAQVETLLPLIQPYFLSYETV